MKNVTVKMLDGKRKELFAKIWTKFCVPALLILRDALPNVADKNIITLAIGAGNRLFEIIGTSESDAVANALREEAKVKATAVKALLDAAEAELSAANSEFEKEKAEAAVAQAEFDLAKAAADTAKDDVEKAEAAVKAAAKKDKENAEAVLAAAKQAEKKIKRDAALAKVKVSNKLLAAEEKNGLVARIRNKVNKILNKK